MFGFKLIRSKKEKETESDGPEIIRSHTNKKLYVCDYCSKLIEKDDINLIKYHPMWWSWGHYKDFFICDKCSIDKKIWISGFEEDMKNKID